MAGFALSPEEKNENVTQTERQGGATAIAPRPWYRRALNGVIRCFDSWAGHDNVVESHGPKKIDWARTWPFFLFHFAVFGVIWVGWSWTAVGVAVFLYGLRMFAITGFYHRYFSHRTFKTSRFMQFVFGVMGNMAMQRGPLWWAAHHRVHHRHSDEEQDPHSPIKWGLFWSHIGWVTSRENARTQIELVPDLAKFPELRFIDRFDLLVPASCGVILYAIGEFLRNVAPGLGTTGAQLFVWGCISTVFLYHGTFTINSLCHLWGSRRFKTTDHSRNNFWLALITLGEGWHNNHHHYMFSTRQGIYWWEIDITFYILKLMSYVGLVRDLRPVPEKVYEEARSGQLAPLPEPSVAVNLPLVGERAATAE